MSWPAFVWGADRFREVGRGSRPVRGQPARSSGETPVERAARLFGAGYPRAIPHEHNAGYADRA